MDEEVFLACYDEDLDIHNFRAKLDAIGEPTVQLTSFATVLPSSPQFQLCFDTALSDQPFAHEKKSQVTEGLKVHMYKVKKRTMVNILKIKSLENNSMETLALKNIDGNYYISLVLSEEAMKSVN